MAAATARTYIEFAPAHSLQEEPGVLVLRVDLCGQGFKKEQIRVQIDNYGCLRIRGERPVGADDGRQWKRFVKEFQVPDSCDAAGIRARLDKDGLLLITMPKLSAEDPKAPRANTGGEGHEPPRRAGAPQAGAAAAEAGQGEKGQEEDAGAAAAMDDGRPGQQDEPPHTTSSDDDDAAAPAARRPAAYGFVKDKRRMLLAIFAVMLALVAAGLFARYRITTMDPSAETASSGNHAVVSLSDS